MILNKDISCCFTGHRILAHAMIPNIKRALNYEIERLYAIGVRNFISGGAIGFDTLAAEQVVLAKQRHPDINLVFVLPCADHTLKWNTTQKRQFEVLSHHASATVILRHTYTEGCMLERNRYMVDNSEYCVSYCGRNFGGTYSTVRYAKAMKRQISELYGCIIPS